MPLTRSDKEALITEYRESLAQAPHAFLLDYKGISVPQVTELRNRVRASGGTYVVVKNTLALRAIDAAALGALKEHFVGPTAVVWSAEDPVALAKALTDFQREVPVIRFKAGMVERRAVAAEQIKEIASLPSREALIAELLFLLQSPIVRLARVLAAVPQGLVSVLDQIRGQKEEASGGAAQGAAPEPGGGAPEPDLAAALAESGGAPELGAAAAPAENGGPAPREDSADQTPEPGDAPREGAGAATGASGGGAAEQGGAPSEERTPAQSAGAVPAEEGGGAPSADGAPEHGASGGEGPGGVEPA